MAEDIRQSGEVFFQGIVRPGKKMAQTVGKDFAWLYTGAFTEGFHFPPDVGAVQGLAGAGDEYGSGGDVLLVEIFLQQAA